MGSAPENKTKERLAVLRTSSRRDPRRICCEQTNGQKPARETCNTSEIVWEGCDRCLESGPDLKRGLAVCFNSCFSPFLPLFSSLPASSPRFLSHDARIWDRGDQQRPSQSERRSERRGRAQGGSTQERHAVDGGDCGRPPASPAAPGRPRPPFTPAFTLWSRVDSRPAAPPEVPLNISSPLRVHLVHKHIIIIIYVY